MKIVILFAAIFFSMMTAADQIPNKCVKVENLKGWALKERNSYELEPDGFSIDTFYLNFGDPDKRDAWMSNDKYGERIPCLNFGTLICVKNGSPAQVMTWSLDDKLSKVIHTRHVGGDFFGGTMMMVGDNVGSCD